MFFSQNGGYLLPKSLQLPVRAKRVLGHFSHVEPADNPR